MCKDNKIMAISTLPSIRPSSILTITSENHIEGIGPVIIRESLGYWTKFCDWLFNRKRSWMEFHTNLGIRHLDVQDESLNARIIAVLRRSIPLGSSVTVPTTQVQPIDALHNACRVYSIAIEQGNAAIAKDMLQKARNLISQGVNPYQQTQLGYSALHFARNHLDLMKVLTGTEHLPAFRYCENIHDFWEVVFPAFTQELPKGADKLIARLTSSSICERIAQAISKEDREKIPTGVQLVAMLEKEEKIRGKPLTSQEILSLLRKEVPQIDAAWNLFKDNPPKVEEVPPSFFDRFKHRVHKPGEGAMYNNETHTIRIEETGSYAQKIYNLGFETMNALQQRSFVELDTVMKAFPIEMTRDPWAFLKEFIENDTAKALQMLAPKAQVQDEDLLEHWRRANLPFGSGLSTHADFYRKQWDDRFAVSHVCKYNQEFESRLRILGKRT